MNGSVALQEFAASLEMAKSLMDIERANYSDPPARRQQKQVEGLRGGAIVLMVGSFEQFLRRLMQEHLTLLAKSTSTLSFEALPEKIRMHNTYETLKFATKGKPYTPQKTRKERIPDIVDACRSIISNELIPEVFCDTGSNPKAETVKNMLNNLGIEDPFGNIKDGFESLWKAPVAAIFIRGKLDEIVNRRHIVAHTADALQITRYDLNEAVRFLMVIAEALDNTVASHIQNIIDTL